MIGYVIILILVVAFFYAIYSKTVEKQRQCGLSQNSTSQLKVLTKTCIKDTYLSIKNRNYEIKTYIVLIRSVIHL